MLMPSLSTDRSLGALSGSPPDFPELASPVLGSDCGVRDFVPVSNAILLIVQDPDIRNLLQFALKQQGFELLGATSAAEGIELAQTARPSAVLLDMDVTNPDGLGVIKRLRDSTRLPILALAGRVSKAGVVDALDCGANDFISRPVDMEELSARLRAARRFAPPPAPEIFRSGSLFVDLTRRVVKVGERIVSLTVVEYSLLRLFVRHAGLVVTHAQILREVWGAEVSEKVNYLRVYLLALRRKLESPHEPSLFVTERAVGYRLVVREPQTQF